MMSIKKMNQLRKAFRALDVDEKRGILTAYNERFLFIPIKLIHSIEDRLRENFGPLAATSLQYEIGREGGAEYARIAQKAGFGIKRPESIREIAEQLGTLSGWGKVEVVDFDFENSRARIRWRNGVSIRNRKGKTPVCHFGRGVLTGAIEAIFGKERESLEVSCQGKGDDYCEAVIADSAEIERVATARGA